MPRVGPHPITIREQTYNTETGFRRRKKTVLFRGLILELYPALPRLAVYKNDIIYVKRGRFQGETFRVVDTYPFQCALAAYVWIYVSEFTGRRDDIICLPVTDVEMVEHIPNYRRVREGGKRYRAVDRRRHKKYNLDEMRADIRYDNWVANFRESDSYLLTSTEKIVFKQIKKFIKHGDQDPPSWVTWTPVFVWGLPSPYKITAALGLRGMYAWTRVMFVIHTLIRKQRIEIIPGDYGMSRRPYSQQSNVCPSLWLRIVDETE